MARAAEAVEQIADFERYYNRARFIDETTHGLKMLLDKEGRKRTWLAKRLGQSGRSAVTKALRGTNNFKLETLADISLALGRAVHVVWGADLGEMRFPVDEKGGSGSERQDATQALQVIIHVKEKSTIENTPHGKFAYTATATGLGAGSSGRKAGNGKPRSADTMGGRGAIQSTLGSRSDEHRLLASSSGD